MPDEVSTTPLARRASGSCEVAISLLGGIPFTDPEGWPDYTGNVNAIDAAVEAGFKRFIFVTSIGTGTSHGYVPEESFLIPLLELKTKAEDYLRESDLDWTIVKPGGLGDFPDEKGQPLVTENPGLRGVIEREPLADVIVSIIDDPDGRTSGKELHIAAHKLQFLDGDATETSVFRCVGRNVSEPVLCL